MNKFLTPAEAQHFRYCARRDGWHDYQGFLVRERHRMSQPEPKMKFNKRKFDLVIAELELQGETNILKRLYEQYRRSTHR